MRPSPEKPDDTELDLPSLDGDDETAPAEAEHDLPEMKEDGLDPFDDANYAGTPDDDTNDVATHGSDEGGWLVDNETEGALDIGPIDVSIQAEGKVLDEDEPEHGAAGRHGLEDLIHVPEDYVPDGGEEGPSDEDEELREEDLPALDADDDGDVPDDALYDRALVTGTDDELRWADRAWARIPELAGPALSAQGEPDDSGILVAAAEDGAAASPRDAAWRRLDETGRSMAAAFVPGGSVVLALGAPDRIRAFLVRIQPDGESRIIAEVDPHTEDDADACTVSFVRWDDARGCLFVFGSFGVHAYRPA